MVVDQTLRLAVKEGRQARIFYSSGGKQTLRIIEVIEFQKDGVLAYCHMRRARRSFKWASILAAELLE